MCRNPTDDCVFSCDLVALAHQHVWFLEQIHACGASLCTNLTHESLRRYRDLWLPLVADAVHATTRTTSAAAQLRLMMIPPPDIAWLWHSHRLAPSHYSTYCQHVFGRVVEANPPFAVAISDKNCQQNSVLEKTQSMWSSRFPNESFFLATKINEVVNTTAETMLGFDLLASAQRQATFLWQVSGDRFADGNFLQEGVDNYAKFLKLQSKAAKLRITLVPTYQIDLIWHTHMLASIGNYDKDCLRIANSKMSHDDSLTDRSENGVLHRAYNATSELWKADYGTDYAVFGGMYRGEPPAHYFSTEWTRDKWKLLDTAPFVSMGAASTPIVPTKWALVTGFTSDGSPAFLPVPSQTRRGVQKAVRMENYILGRCNSTTGYYHLETHEAHAIMVMRMNHLIDKCRSALAMEQACCGSVSAISTLQAKLATLESTRNIWLERRDASKPCGATRTQEINSTPLNRDDGAWYYPMFMYTPVGGACGGVVASSGTCKTLLVIDWYLFSGKFSKQFSR
jgi:hypothetical protein